MNHLAPTVVCSICRAHSVASAMTAWSALPHGKVLFVTCTLCTGYARQARQVAMDAGKEILIRVVTDQLSPRVASWVGRLGELFRNVGAGASR